MNMEDMMKHCCGEGGMPDFNKMMEFMQTCGKKEFSQGDTEMIKQFCRKEGKADPQEMKALMEKCGCHAPAET